jgi:uncharacterized protein HemX
MEMAMTWVIVSAVLVLVGWLSLAIYSREPKVRRGLVYLIVVEVLLGAGGFVGATWATSKAEERMTVLTDAVKQARAAVEESRVQWIKAAKERAELQEQLGAARAEARASKEELERIQRELEKIDPPR